jgi:hypothetical protein
VQLVYGFSIGLPEFSAPVKTGRAALESFERLQGLREKMSWEARSFTGQYLWSSASHTL